MKILVGYDGSDCAEAALDDLTRAGLPEIAEAHILFVGHEEWHYGKHQQHHVIDNTRNRVTLSEILGKRQASEP